MPAASPLLEVGFEVLCVTLPTRRLALDHASGALYPGRVAAIVGPSGAGKSTLLDALAGKVPPPGASSTGEVRLNGVPRSRLRCTCPTSHDSILLDSTSVFFFFFS